MILRQINKEISNYRDKFIQIVPGFTFNQRETIEKVFFYYNSKFVSGSIDEEGDRKYFYNIVKNPCKVFSKAVDFDTKNIRLITTGGGDPTKTWYMERDLKYWMRDKQFGKTLNRIFRELPIFGTVVLKIIDGTPHFVDLRNFIVRQSADTLDQSDFIIEIHNYSVAEFRKIAKLMKWSKTKVEDVVNKFHEMKDSNYIRVYERYSEVKTEERIGDGKYTYKRTFLADMGNDEYDMYGDLTVQHPGIELASEDWEGNPYWEFHAEKMPGRWLGIGVVETLFEPQVRQNELANLQSKASYWAALRIFQTRDSGGANRNLKTDVGNGEILTVESEITQIDMSDRNLAYFNEKYRKWMGNRDEMTFATDAIQGERSPAGTPLGSTQISIGQTLSYFEQIQEDIAMTVKELLYEVIIPKFESESTTEHVLRLVGNDLDTFAEMVKNDLTMKEVIRVAVKTGTIPSKEDKNVISIAVTEAIKQKKEKLLKIPRGFYKDIKYDVDIDITGESIDTRVRYATKFALLQAITSDPEMVTNPVKRKFLFSMAEDGGVNPNELFEVSAQATEDAIAEQTPKKGGGGVSAPQMGQQAQPAQMTQGQGTQSI